MPYDELVLLPFAADVRLPPGVLSYFPKQASCDTAAEEHNIPQDCYGDVMEICHYITTGMSLCEPVTLPW